MYNVDYSGDFTTKIIKSNTRSNYVGVGSMTKIETNTQVVIIDRDGTELNVLDYIEELLNNE